MCGERGTGIQKPHSGGQQWQQGASATQCLSSARDVRHFCDDVGILIIDNHFTYTKGTSLGPVLGCFLENL